MTAVAFEQQPRPPDAGSAQGRAADLLAWYDTERRSLPWRYQPGEKADPYRVWLSEIMLQQTTVKTVIPYYERFLVRWPTVLALANADLDAVLAAWAGLGYYSRARNLHACAQIVARDHGGSFPRTTAGLLQLPGIGPYTAAAIAAIAFGEHAMPVDGNVERVVARLFAVTEPLPVAKPRLRELAAAMTPQTRAGDFAQAMMDLGATVCRPRRPSCLMCPLNSGCAASAIGIAPLLPARGAKTERPVRRGVAFVALREDGHVLLRRRAEAGLLGGMLEMPSTDWVDDWVSAEVALRSAPVRADWWSVPGMVSHTFTHFRLEVMVFRGLTATETPLNLWAEPGRCRWVHRRDLDGVALPSAMQKIIAHALGR